MALHDPSPQADLRGLHPLPGGRKAPRDPFGGDKEEVGLDDVVRREEDVHRCLKELAQRVILQELEKVTSKTPGQPLVPEERRRGHVMLSIDVTPLLSNPIDVIEAVGEVARGRAKPVLAVMMATDEFYEAVKQTRDLPPVYRFPESAARAMFMLARYAAWRRRPADGAPPEFGTDDGAVAEILATVQDGYLGWTASPARETIPS